MRTSLFMRQWLQRQNGTASELMRTARRVEQKRAAQHKKQRLEPNPYHKAQYISAYLEAKSAVISQHKAVKRRHAEEETDFVPAHSKANRELSLLSEELHKSYGDRPHHNSAVERAESGATHLAQSPSIKKKKQQRRVSFGEWRESVPSIQRGLHSVDVRLHTIARGGLTPPSLSAEALKRGAGPLMKALRPLLNRTQEINATANEAAAQSLAADLVTLLDDLTAKGKVKPSERSGAVSLYIQELFSCATAWQPVHTFLEAYLYNARGARRGGGGGGDFFYDACQQIAVFAECTHFYNCGKDGPTVKQLAQLCQAAQGGNTRRRLTSLAAAPLLSILYAVDADDSKAESVHTFVSSYLLQSRKHLVYLHSSAWGEYVKAIHRFGASAAEIQALVDKCTDEHTTVNAAQHLSSAHVWNAYLACSEAAHALEVYENNKAHYKLKGTAATTAALMTSLAQSHTTARSTEALRLFRVLQQRGGDMVHYTASTLVALLSNYRVLKDLPACLDMALSFETFFAPFGCSEEVFAAARRNAMGSTSPDAADAQRPALIRALVCAVYAQSKSVFPKIVFDAWMAAYDDITQAEKALSSQSTSSSAFPELTPDDLMDLL